MGATLLALVREAYGRASLARLSADLLAARESLGPYGDAFRTWLRSIAWQRFHLEKFDRY